MGNPYQNNDPEEMGETLPDSESGPGESMGMPPMASPSIAADKGGSKMGGGFGAGAEAPSNGDVGEAGYKCEASFPLTGEFWTRDPKHGQA